MKLSREQIEEAVKAKGYVWFEGSKDYDVNIVGVRNSDTGQKVTNLFDDAITVSYKKDGEWMFRKLADLHQAHLEILQNLLRLNRF